MAHTAPEACSGPIKCAFFQKWSKSPYNFLPMTLNCSEITLILVGKEVTTTGADMVSTEVAKPEVHAEAQITS